MKDTTLKMSVALAAACMTFTASFAATINWKADDSGNWSGDFGDVKHWEGGTVPGSSDEARFPAASSPNSFTVTVNANYSVGDIWLEHYDSAGRKVTFSGTGKISTANQVSVFGRYTHASFDGVSFYSAGETLAYGTVEVLTGSTFTYARDFYLHEPDIKIIVDGGTCSFQQLRCGGTSLRSGIFVKSGSLSATNLLGNYADKPLVLEVSGGTAEFNKLARTASGGKIKLSGGTLKVKTDAVDALNVAADVEVSLTGGTFYSGHSITDQRFYATDGTDVETASARFVMVTNGAVTAKSAGALITRGFYYGATTDCVMHGTFPKIIFANPDGHFYVTGNARNFYFYGPTIVGTKCNMVFNPRSSTSYTYFKGDFTVDTLDYADRTTPRTIWIRGLHPLDGEATLTVTGGGTFQMLETHSYNSFKSVTVNNGTTLALLDYVPATAVDMGPLVTEAFTMKPNSALTLTAGANFVQAKAFTIDSTATITVDIPSTFTAAVPILQTTDQTAPAVSLSQITLTGSTSGVLLKNENGQVTVYKPGTIDGTYATEWTGAGADNSFSTAANWYGGELPTSSQTIYFGASTVTNPKWGVVSGGGATVKGYQFRDTATETFNYSSGGETLEAYSDDARTFCVGTWSHVPQIVNGRLRRPWSVIGFESRGLAPLVLSGDGTYTWAYVTENSIGARGDVRLNKNGYIGHGVIFYDAIASAPYTRLTVMPGITATLSTQTRDLNIKHACMRVEDGATLTFGNENGAVYRWSLEPAKQIVNGTLDIQAPFYGGVKQTYGGTGRMNIATVKSGTAASRVQFADGLNVYPGDWTTVTSDADNPVAITAIGGTPTIHLASNWRYGVASGVTTASAAAARALTVEKGAELTIDAGGYTATIDEDIAGEGALVITNGTLAVNSTATNDVTLKVAASGVLALPNNLNVGSLELQDGSSIAPFSSLKNQRGWQTVLVAADGVTASGCTLPAGFEMRTASVEGGVALQLRYVHGSKFIIR